MKKSYAVFGLGRYGKTIIHELVNAGVDVLAVDMDENVVEKEKNNIPICKCADVTNKDVLLQLGVSNIDTVVIAMAEHLEQSIVATMLCKEIGVKNVIVKCSTEFNKKILLKLGADKVVIPEIESGIRLAKSILSNKLTDIFDVSSDISIAEIEINKDWVGKTLAELNLRKKYSINVVAVKRGENVMVNLDPDMPLESDMLLLVVAEMATLNKVLDGNF